MQKIIAKRIISEKDAEKLGGKHLLAEDCQTVLTEDADVFDVHGNLLIRFRKNVVDRELLKQCWDAYKDSIAPTNARGLSAGEYYFQTKKDGSLSNFKVSPQVETGNVGFMDGNASSPYCRMTMFGQKHVNKLKAGIPFVEHIDKLYEQFCPEYHKRQKAIADATNRNYVLGNSSFTTVTVNLNWQTACHKDSGDLPGGFGNIIVIDDGNYDGAITFLPEFGIGCDVRTGDIMFCDVHKWHCNTPFIPKAEKYLRGTFVIYYREFMLQCKQPSEELKQLKMDKGGFMKL